MGCVCVCVCVEISILMTLLLSLSFPIGAPPGRLVVNFSPFFLPPVPQIVEGSLWVNT